VIRFELNGRPLDPGSLKDQMVKSVMVKVGDHLHQKISAIRHPETGEFPTVLVTGTDLTDIQAHAEGSPELIAIVRERLAKKGVAPPSPSRRTDASGPPIVFLSYAWEDDAFAESVARALQAKGIDTWWAGWSMKAGDSLPQEINEGLARCTHFVVLLTPISMGKPWVKQEMNAALVRKIADQCAFIALRCGVSARDLPPLLAPLLSPEITGPNADLTQLINDIHGVSRKPRLGEPPTAVSQRSSRSGYSPAATAIARVFVIQSENGLWADPQLSLEELASAAELTLDDVTDGVHELSAMLEDHQGTIIPKAELFATFDHLVHPWNPSDDAMRLAADMVNDPDFPGDPSAVATLYNWSPRRLNPAIAYLESRKLIEARHGIGPGPYGAHNVGWTPATRRFVRSRGL
jgi:hypothetical protein